MLRRYLILFGIFVLAVAIWFGGPLLYFGTAAFLAPLAIRVSLVLTLAIVGLLVLFHRPSTEEDSARAYTRTGLMVWLLSAPILVMTGLAIFAIERSYQRIKDATSEMRATLDRIDADVSDTTFRNLRGINAEVLQPVRTLIDVEPEGFALPMLDPKTDRDYLYFNYQQMLNNHLRSELMVSLEEQILANLTTPQFLYDPLKIYMMLAELAPLDRALIQSWVEVDLRMRFPGVVDAEFREYALLHLDTMLDGGVWSEYQADPDLIVQAQRALARIPVAERVYTLIMSDPAVLGLMPWRPDQYGGAGSSRLFSRDSGTSLTEGIPGVFTRQGFHEVFLPLADAATEIALGDTWVLGPFVDAGLGSGAMQARLSQDILQLYYDEYIAHWDMLLADLTLKQIGSLTDLVDVIELSIASTSPLESLLRAVVWETRLSQPPNVTAPEDDTLDLATLLRNDFSADRIRIAQISSSLGASEALTASARYVEDYFAPLIDWAGTETLLPQTELKDLRNLLVTIRAGANPEAASTQLPFQVANLRLAAERMPPPLNRWLASMMDAADALASTQTRFSVNTKWQTNVLQACQSIASGRYPFDRRAITDAPLDGFARLFAPGGLIDTFFYEELAGLVNTASQPWQWREDIDLSRSALRQIQRALEIRDAFFSVSPQPTAAFTITIDGLSDSVKGVELELDGIVLAHVVGGKPIPHAMAWPGSPQIAELRVQPLTGEELKVSFDGPWAVFRLFETFQRTPAPSRAPDVSYLRADVEGFEVQFQLRAGRLNNPFDSDALKNFRCPEVF